MSAEFWDEKFRSEEYIYGVEPNDYIQQRAPLIPSWSSILEGGAGEGRNAVYLAELGHQVTTIDLSQAGVEKMNRLARSRGVTVKPLVGNILEFQPESEFDVFLSTFLHLPPESKNALLAKMVQLTRAGGHILGEWFHPDQRNRGYTSGGPPSPDMMFRAEELEQFFKNHRILHLEEKVRDLAEGSHHRGSGAVVQIHVELNS